MKTSPLSAGTIAVARQAAPRLLSCFVALTTLAAVIGRSNAAVLLAEQFNYGTIGGSLYTQAGTVWTERSDHADPTVASGSLTYSGLAPSVGNKLQLVSGNSEGSANLSASVSSGDIYFSFLVQVTADLGGHKDIFSLQTSTGGAGMTVSLADAGANIFHFEISKQGGGGTEEATARALNTTFLVVGHHQFVAGNNNDLVEIWINPSGLGGTPPPATFTDTTGSDFSGAYGRAYILSTFDNVFFDELRVGTM